jgi:GNAT superfamily N-acetyltransferase
MRVATAIERWKQSLESGGEETWVVEAEGIVQGFMTMGDSRDPDKDASSFELWGIYVDPGFLRRGRGAELVAHCLAEAERRGKKEVLLWVFEKNPIGRSFYEKQGFRPEGLSQVIEKFGAVELRYVKTLGPGAWAAGRS